jgi:hypothetical protein
VSLLSCFSSLEEDKKREKDIALIEILLRFLIKTEAWIMDRSIFLHLFVRKDIPTFSTPIKR